MRVLGSLMTSTFVHCRIMLTLRLLILFSLLATGEFDLHPAFCKNVTRLGHEAKDRIYQCWNISDGSNWYGGGTSNDPYWPIQRRTTLGYRAAVTGDIDGSAYSINSRFWMSSSGLAINIDDDVPLFLRNDFDTEGLLCFQSFNVIPYNYRSNIPPKLSYTLCEIPQSDPPNITHFYLSFRKTFFRLPADIPDESLFRLPYWTTFPKLLRPSSSDILAFAVNISTFMRQVRPNSNCYGTIHIHDWEACEGSLQFGYSKIPDPKKLFNKIASLGLRIALQTHPFVNRYCDDFQEAYNGGFLVSDSTTYHPAPGFWMGKEMYVIDMTNKVAVDWWSRRLRRLQDKYGVSSFVFDGGLSSALPRDCILSNDHILQPGVFTTRFAEAAASLGRLGVVTSASQSHHLPIFVRANRLRNVGLGEPDSLKGAIPNVLLAGLIGYPFILPEVIGGTYGFDKPSKTVYIRWLQLSTFLPAMHMSFGPWEYGPDVMVIAREMFNLRAKFEDYLLEVAKQATIDGSPIIRPLWWLSPNDKNAQVIDDEYLVGDDLLVAPVMDTSTETAKRHIYLPEGKWKDEHDSIHEGPKWLYNRTVQIKQLAFFTRV